MTTNTCHTTTTTSAFKMLSFFRKSSSKSSVMAQANNSETTLVSFTSTKKQRKVEPYQPEFTGMGLGGMPSMGPAHFLPPPSVSPTESNSSKSSFSSGPGKLVASQPFKSTSSSVVQERLSTTKSMFSTPRSQPWTASEKLEEIFTPSSMMMGGGTFVVRFSKSVSSLNT